ncbi:MAG: hypothetical protein K6F34_00990 [Lachnospiraceae bacterium]|nr:hypothetical protein [Lachnospiraceae bacterium]
MKQKLTNNLGLKLISVVLAVVVWLIVVSIDDPVISRTFNGIEVELLNTDAITSQGKVYEVTDGSDNISVTLSAKRSVLEKISRDHIKASADLKEMTILNSVAIDVRTTRYSDMISTITPLTKNLKINIEDLEKKQLSINVETVGNPAKGYVVGSNSPSVNITSVSGPASVVSRLSRAVATVDVSGALSDIRASSKVVLYDGNGDVVNVSSLTLGVTEILVDVSILETKEVPVSASFKGSPADGYAALGTLSIEPETVLLAGSGSAFDSLTEIVIPPDAISIDGAVQNTLFTLDVNDYLPGGVRLAGEDYDGTVEIIVHVGQLETMPIDIPVANITVENVPAGYAAAFAEAGGMRRIEVQGLHAELAALDTSRITGTVDASSMKPREEFEGMEGFHAGAYDGSIRWSTPAGITVVGSSMIEVDLYFPAEAPQGAAIEAVPQGGE